MIFGPDEYVCKTCDETVRSGEVHTHSCPLEDGEACSDRRCNETGLCQA